MGNADNHRPGFA